MAEIEDLSTTDANNTGRFPEGQNPSTLNDGGRALEGMVARAWFDAVEPTSITATASTSNAWNITPNRSITCAQGLRLCFVAPAGNSGAVTIDIGDGKGAHALEQANGSAFSGGEIPKDQFVEAMFEASASVWQAMNYTGIAALVTDTSPQLGGALDPNGNIIRFAKGGDIASASPLVLDTDGNYFDVTGTTGFSQITCTAGDFFMLQFDGALTMTDGANLDLGGNDITTAAGDRALFYAVAANTAQLQSYFTEGSSPSAPGQSEAEAGTATIPRPWTAQRVKQAVEALAPSSGITWLGSQASTSGTSIDFTSIPSTATMIVVTFKAVSNNDGSDVLVQIGDSGGLETTGYDSAGMASATEGTSTSGFLLNFNAASNAARGTMTLYHEGSNLWSSSHHMSTDGGALVGGGTKTLSGTLDRLSVTVASGAFDGGSINVGYL